MSQGIFLINSGEELVEMRHEPYESEDLLQRLLASHPQVLAGDQFDSSRPRRWLLIRREASIPGADGGGARWSIDHVFLDQDAVPTLVEVKRSTDTRIRREVVGQMLDYAANAVVYWPVDHLRAEHEARCRARGVDPDEELRLRLEPDGDAAMFWQKVKTNLQAGRVRLVFVADEIPPELRRIVEFLNQQMDPAEVLALEVRQYVGKGLRTLVPSIIGQTAEAQQRKGTAEARQWDEPQFFEELAAQRPALEVEAARRLMEWAKRSASSIWFGSGARSGSFIPVLDHGGIGRQLFSVYTYGSVEILFQYYKVNPPFDDEAKRREMLERLNAIEGVSIPIDAISRRPSIRLGTLTAATACVALLETFEWFIDQVRRREAPLPA